MSWFNFFKKRFEPLRMTDPVFGGISFAGYGFWEGNVYFEPTGQQVKVYIDGNAAEGPTEKQQEFYQELERRYGGLEATIGDLLHREFTYRQEDFPRASIWEEFKLASISIRDVDGGELEWELSYACASDDHSFDVQMTGWVPEDVAING